MYENGKGVAKNDEQALQWYRKSAKQGETFAIEAIKSLESS